MKIQCDVPWNRYIFQSLSFLRQDKIFWFFLPFTPLTSEREWKTTLMCSSIPQHLLWDFSIVCRKAQSWSLMTVGYPTQLINLKHGWNVACVSLLYHYCSRFCLSEIIDLFAGVMYFYATLGFMRDNKLRMWLISKHIYVPTDIICSLVELFLCWTPFVKRLLFYIQKNCHRCSPIT